MNTPIVQPQGKGPWNTVEPANHDAIPPYDSGVDKVAQLPGREFLACNRESGAELKRKLF